MFLGLRTKTKKGETVQAEYVVHIQEIKPWPPSQSLKSLSSVFIRWENGHRNSGSTKAVTPSSTEDGKIIFNESFKLRVTLVKDVLAKGDGEGAFLKNVLEFNLHESGMLPKGRHIGNAVIDFARYGVIKEAMSVSVPLNCKRSYKSTSQSRVHVKIQPFGKKSTKSSLKESVEKEMSSEKEEGGSVSELMNDEYAEEAEIASFTDDDDDDSSQTSQSTLSACPSETNISPLNVPEEKLNHEKDTEHASKKTEVNVEDAQRQESLPERQPVKLAGEMSSPDIPTSSQSFGSSQSSIPDSGEPGSSEEGEYPLSDSGKRGDSIRSSFSSLSSGCSVGKLSAKYDGPLKEDPVDRNKGSCEDFIDIVAESAPNDVLAKTEFPDLDQSPEREKSSLNNTDHEMSSTMVVSSKDRSKQPDEIACNNDQLNKKKEEAPPAEEVNKVEQVENDLVEAKPSSNNRSVGIVSSSIPSTDDLPPKQHRTALRSSIKKPVTSSSPKLNGKAPEGGANSTHVSATFKPAKSVRLSSSSMANSLTTTNHLLTEEMKGQHFVNGGGSSSKKVKRASFSKIRELELKLEMLEAELTESASIEVALYSIVAEHGSSAHKVHTPARRLSRLYIHASKYLSHKREASVARSCVSGLILAAKACGNDIPRLTFWLSNSVMLRAIITMFVGNSNVVTSSGSHDDTSDASMGTKKNDVKLKWESTNRETKMPNINEDFGDWDDPDVVLDALKRVEGWIFSRVVESAWWQSLTPYMQCQDDNWQLIMHAHTQNRCGKSSGVTERQQAYFSIGLWRRAFKETFERLCPVRAAGHECGCLSMLTKLVMEQCVARLDVAMFNAVMRGSDDDMPTDPVSDPISDSRVLPIPSGRYSFSVGAQLKNAIGNWSMWLSDLLDIEDGFSGEKKEQVDEGKDMLPSSKPFRLLNALSDLLMLPKEMLLESSTARKKVCPMFSALMVKQILIDFVPDDFCQNPVPNEVFECLDAEDAMGVGGDISSIPCGAGCVIYSPASASSVVKVVGDAENSSFVRSSGSSIVHKCHTSDDELDELDSPFTTVVLDKSLKTECKNKDREHANLVRYQLLREVWGTEHTLNL